MKCRLPLGIDLTDIYGTKFTFAKMAFSESQILEKMKALKSPAWMLCEDPMYWYIIHEERLYNFDLKTGKHK